MTLLAEQAPRTLDPGFQFEFGAQLLGLAHDGLVTFEHTSGPRGLQLVPDLAVSVPTPTASATTFEFQLRPGIRYSNGVPVRASDFRRAFERLFRGRSLGAELLLGTRRRQSLLPAPGRLHTASRRRHRRRPRDRHLPPVSHRTPISSSAWPHSTTPPLSRLAPR